MLNWSRKDTYLCAGIVTKIFDAIAQTLDGMIVELRGSTETDKKKLTEALLATRKLSHDIRTMIKVKSRIFRANYDRPQKRQLEELEGISAELEKIADEHESLAGTSGVVMDRKSTRLNSSHRT